MRDDLTKHYKFQKAEDKLIKKLDVVTLVQSIRQLELISYALLDERQNFMLKFQRKNVIESDTNTDDSDCDRRAAATKPEVMKMMDSKNPMVRMVIFGRMKKMVKNYQLQEIPPLDKRLIRGLYDKRLKD